MHVMDAHIAAGEKANSELLKKYHTDAFKNGTPEHDFWLAEYDRAFASFIGKSGS